MLPVDASVRLAGLLAVENGALAADDAYLVVLTEKGLVKKTPLSAFAATSLWVVVGVSADNIFVFHETWRQASRRC